MTEAQTIRVEITEEGAPFFTGDLEVWPWHIGQYGGDWEAWLHRVAPELIDRAASGVREETFRAVATDTASGQTRAEVQFTHSTPKTVTVTVQNHAAEQLGRLVNSPDAMTVTFDHA